MSNNQPARYYAERQTNAGPNQGKWRVKAPDGISVGPVCENLRQALHLAAVFSLAEDHPEGGYDVRFVAFCRKTYFRENRKYPIRADSWEQIPRRRRAARLSPLPTRQLPAV